MPPTSSIPAFLDNLKTLLDARAGLIGPPLVTVATGDLGTETPREAIILYGTPTAEREEVGMRGPAGFSYDHNVTVAGVIWIVKPGQGEPVIKQARDRAFDLLDEIDAALAADPKVGGACYFAAVTGDVLEQGANDEGRWCQLNLLITYRARLV